MAQSILCHYQHLIISVTVSLLGQSTLSHEDLYSQESNNGMQSNHILYFLVGFSFSHSYWKLIGRILVACFTISHLLACTLQSKIDRLQKCIIVFKVISRAQYQNRQLSNEDICHNLKSANNCAIARNGIRLTTTLAPPQSLRCTNVLELLSWA